MRSAFKSWKTIADSADDGDFWSAHYGQSGQGHGWGRWNDHGNSGAGAPNGGGSAWSAMHHDAGIHPDQAGACDTADDAALTDTPVQHTADPAPASTATAQPVPAPVPMADPAQVAETQAPIAAADADEGNATPAPAPIATTPVADPGHAADALPAADSMATDQAAVASSSSGAMAEPIADHGFQLGINLSSAAFGSVGQSYEYPDAQSIDYYAGKGFDVVRLPFLWERLQPAMNGELSQQELQQMDATIAEANAQGMKVILDPHNFGSGFGNVIGSDGTPNSAFADMWGKLAGHYADNPNVMFGLMNEPHEQTPEQWVDSANAAIAAIRASGASQQILVPGTSWDSAANWVSSGGAETIGNGIKDPAGNYAIELHQYLDSDASGTHNEVVSADIGPQRLAEATQWAEQTGHKLFLGEIGVATDQQSLTALDNTLSYMQQHSGAWQGVAYWAGGPGWGDYAYAVEPANGMDRPQMAILDHYA